MITAGWTRAHIQFYQATAMCNWILLDNQSTVTIFCNPNMVSNIRDTNETLALMMNAGVLLMSKKADVPRCGEMVVTYNLNKKDAFIVHLLVPQASQVPPRSQWTLYLQAA